MKLLQTILDAQGGDAVRQLAQSFNLQEDQAKGALGQLLPALTSGLGKNMKSQRGLDSLLGALSKGNHQRYLEEPRQLADNSVREEGNAILGHILGSKNVSRRVASRAASKTGLDSGLLKKMLPVVATMAMGALSQQSKKSGIARGKNQAEAGGILSSLLDADYDGSVVDDLMGFAKKLF